MGVTEDHIKASFEAFLQIYPEYNDIVAGVSRTLQQEVAARALPRNQDCLRFLQDCLRLEENLRGDQYAAYQEISGFPDSCPREATDALEILSGHLVTPGLINNLARQFSADTLKRINRETQGLTPYTKEELVDVIARDHLEAIAELTREAATFALLNDECAQLPDIIAELEQEGLPAALSPQERFGTFLMYMSGHFARAVTAHMTAHFDHPTANITPDVAPAPSPKALSLDDILKKFNP